MPTSCRGERTIHWVVEGQGPSLLLVPGLGSGARLFGTLPRRFARQGFRCAAIDPVGVPPSSDLPEGRFDFDAAAADVLAVARDLGAPTTLVGTSLGGKVALRAAVLQPALVHRLVLLCSAAAVSARARRVYRMFELLASRVEGAWLGELLAPLLFGSTFLRDKAAVVDDIVRSMRTSGSDRALMLAQATALQQFDGSGDARACTVPTLCLAGAEDTLTPADEVAATAGLLPHGTYRSIAAAGHSLLLESSCAFEAVVQFART